MLDFLTSATSVVWGLLFTATGHVGLQTLLKKEMEMERIICKSCVEREDILAPGVGIDLMRGYGTVAIRYHNKSIVDVGRIDGSPEYKELMKRLAPPYSLKYPPFEDFRDQLKWDYEQAQRAIRRARHLPSTEDIQTLSNFFSELYHIASSTNGHSLSNNVLISSTAIPNLPSADLDEALKFANLTLVRNRQSYSAPMPSLNAVYATMGYGICEHWADFQKCDLEEAQEGPRSVIGITYTGEELAVETAYAATAYWVYPDTYARYPEYGFSSDLPHDDSYWTGIKERITTVLKASDATPEILILLGDKTGDKMFLDAVGKALGELKITGLLVHKLDGEMDGARGAAEFAKRAQGEPKGCVEGDWCHNRIPGEDGMGEKKDVERQSSHTVLDSSIAETTQNKDITVELLEKVKEKEEAAQHILGALMMHNETGDLMWEKCRFLHSEQLGQPGKYLTSGPKLVHSADEITDIEREILQGLLMENAEAMVTWKKYGILLEEKCKSPPYTIAPSKDDLRKRELPVPKRVGLEESFDKEKLKQSEKEHPGQGGIDLFSSFTNWLRQLEMQITDLAGQTYKMLMHQAVTKQQIKEHERLLASDPYRWELSPTNFDPKVLEKVILQVTEVQYGKGTTLTEQGMKDAMETLKKQVIEWTKESGAKTVVVVTGSNEAREERERLAEEREERERKTKSWEDRNRNYDEEMRKIYEDYNKVLEVEQAKAEKSET